MRKIMIREARKEEAAQIAQLFLLAWPVEEMAQSGGISAQMLLEAVTGFAEREDTIYSYTKTFVAEVAAAGEGGGCEGSTGEIVGAMCGYDGADYQKLKQPIVDILGEDSDFAQLRETEAGEYYLDSVGIEPEFRGMGIGRLLVEAFCERAFEEGHERVGLIVDYDNPQAERLYSSVGFQRVGERLFFGHRMWHLQRTR
jgi:ribosomal protein S18 acetylase RimI-like enzyme